MNKETREMIFEWVNKALRNKRYWHERKHHAAFDFDLFLQDIREFLNSQPESDKEKILDDMTVKLRERTKIKNAVPFEYVMADLIDVLNTQPESERIFNGEFESDTIMAELTQFNKHGEKIAHFIYTLPDREKI